MTYLARTSDISVQAHSLPQDHWISISGEEKTNSLAPQSPNGGTSFGARPRIPPPVSPRTAKYVQAMVREGDGFDYNQWLQRVREEEAEAKRVYAAGASGELVAAQTANPIKTSDHQLARANPALSLIPKMLLKTRRWHLRAKSKTPKDRLRRWLEKVRRACGECQASRRRDAVYGYLEEVLAIVEHYRVRRKTKRLLRHAFKFANLPFKNNADAFSAVLRCTCGNSVDAKTVSKWARALRYVARCKKPDAELWEFMKEAGGVNACAARYAKYYGRCVRQISRG
jgi:hypothetical protein